MEGEVAELVVRDKIAGKGFAVVRSEELCRSMPELTGLVFSLLVQLVFEVSVAFTQFGVKGCFVGKRIEVEGRARGEYRDILGKVSVTGIV